MIEKTNHKCETVSLRDYFDERLRSIDIQLHSLYKEVELKNENIKTSTKLAADALNDRLQHLNAARELLTQLTHTMLTRAEFNLVVDKIDKEITDMRTFKDNMQGAATQKSVLIAGAIALIGIVIAIISLLR